MAQRPQTLAEAKRFKGAEVVKEFEEEATGIMRPFKGKVIRVTDKFLDEATNSKKTVDGIEYLYDIKYLEDSDEETLEWDEVVPILQPGTWQNPVAQTPAAALAARTAQKNQGSSAAASGSLQPSTQPTTNKRRTAFEVNSESDPKDPASVQLSGQQQQQPKRRNILGSSASTSGPLTERSLNTQAAPTPGNAPGPSKGGAGPSKARAGPSKAPVVPARAASGPPMLALAPAPEEEEAPAAMEVDDLEIHEQFRTRGLPGHVKRVVLQSFMCHDHLHVEFGPHVTLISGQNGSGKSAILQGLQICLGLAARETGRGTQLTGFIKHGADVAVVQVTLWNEGSAAYKPELYGKQVTIERKLRRAGGNDYKVYGAQGSGRGAYVSTKKEELDACLEHLGIDASNPLTIITQDMARHFHSGGAADKRYKFEKFMHGTMLDVSQAQMVSARERLDQSIEQVKAGEARCLQLEEEVDRMTKELAKLQDMKNLQEESVHLENFAAWQRLAALRQYADQAQQALADEEARLEGCRQAVVDSEMALAMAKELSGFKMASLQRAMEEVNQVHDVITRLKEGHAQARSTRIRYQKEAKAVKETLLDLMTQKEDYEAELTQAAASQADTGRVQEARRRLAEFGELMQARNVAIQELDQEYNDLRREAAVGLSREQELEGARGNLARAIRYQREPEVVKLQQDLELLSSDSNNRATFFGPKLAQLHQLVNNNLRSFQHPPIGPVGAYLGLTDSRWAKAVEGAVGPVMQRFVCCSKQDLATLNSMARSLNMGAVNAFVVRPNLPQHNVRVNGPQGCTMLLDVLRVEHPDPASYNTLFNVLVDKAFVENTILVRDETQARDIAYDPQFKPFSIVDADGTSYRMRGKGTFVMSRSKWNGPPRVGAALSEMRQHRQRELEAATEQLQQARHELSELEGELGQVHQHNKQMTAKSAELMTRKKHMKADLREFETQQERLRPEADQDENEEAHRINAATQEIRKCQLDIGKFQGNLIEREQALRQALEEEEAAKQAWDEKRNFTGQDFSALSAEIETLAHNEAKAARDLQASRDRLRGQQNEVQKQKGEVEGSHAALPEAEALADAMCTDEQAEASEVHVRNYFKRKLTDARNRPRGRAAGGSSAGAAQADDGDALEARLQEAMHWESLLKEVTAVQTRIAAAESNAGGNAEQIESELEQVTKKVTKKRIAQRIVAEQLRRLRRGHNTRAETFDDMKAHVRDGVSGLFNKFMRRRQHLGEMRVDYEEQTLSVRVKIKATVDPKAKWVEDLKQLSGGERSYTTVCLLLALAQYCEFPFHCLDEYDVYMDAVIRRVATEMLLHFASDARARQVILLTPQDIDAVDEAKKQLENRLNLQLPANFIKTVRMAPPARPTGAGAADDGGDMDV